MRSASQRDGVGASFIDAASGDTAPFAAQLAAVVTLVAEDAEALGCTAFLEHTKEIAAAGTSADRQRAVLAEAQAGPGDTVAGLRAVVDWIAATTG